MLERDDAIVFLAAWPDACALWRLYMPHLVTPGSSFFCFSDKPDYGFILGNDIVVVQRCCMATQFHFLDQCFNLGLRIVYDLDDDVWDVPEYNPAYAPLRHVREGFAACIRLVDCVTVSTKRLKDVVHKNVRDLRNMRTGKAIPVVVAENKIMRRMFAPPLEGKERFIVGWAGSSSHVGDLPLIEPALLEVGASQNVVIQCRGQNVAEDSPLQKLPNFEFKYWTAVTEYGGRMPRWGWSIALAPVTDHPFNTSKSCIKMVEAGYCGIPCLASWVRPYEEFVHHDKELQWLLCAGASSFTRKLKELVNDTARREEYGQRMRRVVEEHYTLDAPHPVWEQVFQELRKGSK